MSKMNYNIIVADDDSDIVESITTQLEIISRRFGYQVHIFKALSATDIFLTLSTNPVDIVFLDYHFEGGKNGNEIIDQIEDQFNQKLIVLMSGRDKREIEGCIINKHKQMGQRFKFLRKPCEDIELQSQFLEFEKFFASFPLSYPLAYPKKKLEEEKGNKDHIRVSLLIKDLYESIMKFSIAVMMAELKYTKKTSRLKINISLCRELTFGACFDWFKSLYVYLSETSNDTFMPKLVALFNKSTWEPEILKFKTHRDKIIAHGYVTDSEKIDEYIKGVKLLIEHLKFTIVYPLFIVTETDFSSDEPAQDEHINYNIKLLMGSERIFSNWKIRSKQKLRQGYPYLANPQGAITPLYPLIYYKFCEQCRLAQVYMIDSVSENDITYNAPCNHRFSDKQAKKDFDSKFSHLCQFKDTN